MGLDSYLSAKHYVSRWDYADGKRTERPEFTEAVKGLGDMAKYLGDDALGLETTFTVMYWRKVNAIHSWFVRNVQDGEDECHEYYVSVDNLRELSDACGAVVRHDFNPAIVEEFLAPTDGFFFGSTEVDDWYKDNITNTFNELNSIIAMADEDAANGKYVTFSYRSSW